MNADHVLVFVRKSGNVVVRGVSMTPGKTNPPEFVHVVRVMLSALTLPNQNISLIEGDILGYSRVFEGFSQYAQPPSP